MPSASAWACCSLSVRFLLRTARIPLHAALMTLLQAIAKTYRTKNWIAMSNGTKDDAVASLSCVFTEREKKIFFFVVFTR